MQTQTQADATADAGAGGFPPDLVSSRAREGPRGDRPTQGRYEIGRRDQVASVSTTGACSRT